MTVRRVACALALLLSMGVAARDASADDKAQPPTPPGTDTPMRALSFLVGDWHLDYTATQDGRMTSDLRGVGSFRYLFGATYLTFDYKVLKKDSGELLGEAHALFAWDAKVGLYRYYWFESSGTFLQATAVLRDDQTLALEWLGVDCTQVFRRVSADALYLEMVCPGQGLRLRVDFRRQGAAAQPR